MLHRESLLCPMKVSQEGPFEPGFDLKCLTRIRLTTSGLRSIPKVIESCWAIRGQPQRGLRCLNSTTAAMISRLGPLGPGFDRFPLENRNLYFWRTRNSLSRRNVEGLKAMAVYWRRLVVKKIEKKASQIRCRGKIAGARFRPRLRTRSCCLSMRF
jgi:hypothetical protein